MEHVLLADRVDGEQLTIEHGAPVRSVCAGRYFYKSLKWLRQIELLEVDVLGFWERESSYHNNADPLLQEDYVRRPMAPTDFARRCKERDFKGAFAIKDPQFESLEKNKIDLMGASFEGAQIKGCDLNSAQLRGAQCKKANFTKSKFGSADLRDADLSYCDLEGTDFRGADLRNADLRYSALTATRFAKSGAGAAKIEGAKFLRQDLANGGLSERDRAFILDPQRKALVFDE